MTDDWKDYLLRKVDLVHKDVGDIKVEIGMLKVKSSVWGMLGGALSVIAAILIQKIK